METSLRPMSLGEILDRTAQLYRTNFLLFAGIASVYAGVLLLLGLAQTGAAQALRMAHMNRALIWVSGVSVLVTWIAAFIFGGIAGAANNRAVAWVHLGEPATIRGAYRSILPHVGRYLWLGFLKLIYAWLPVIVIYGIFIFIGIYFKVKGLLPGAGQPQPHPQLDSAAIAFGLLAVFLMLALVPAFLYGIFMELRYALAVPACVVESLTARDAIRRSIALSKASRGRIFVLGLLVTVIAVGLVLVTQIFFFVAALKAHGQLPAGLLVLQQFVAFATTTFVAPIPATGLTLFYYDQRVRKEGYDIEWMMQAAGLTWSPAPALTAPEPGGSMLPPAPESAHE